VKSVIAKFDFLFYLFKHDFFGRDKNRLDDKS